MRARQPGLRRGLELSARAKNRTDRNGEPRDRRARDPYTGPAAAPFYGVTMLIAAWRGEPSCEGTVVSNWILRRDDQIGCPVFFPIDAAEERLTARKGRVDRTRAGEV